MFTADRHPAGRRIALVLALAGTAGAAVYLVYRRYGKSHDSDSLLTSIPSKPGPVEWEKGWDHRARSLLASVPHVEHTESYVVPEDRTSITLSPVSNASRTPISDNSKSPVSSSPYNPVSNASSNPDIEASYSPVLNASTTPASTAAGNGNLDVLEPVPEGIPVCFSDSSFSLLSDSRTSSEGGLREADIAQSLSLDDFDCPTPFSQASRGSVVSIAGSSICQEKLEDRFHQFDDDEIADADADADTSNSDLEMTVETGDTKISADGADSDLTTAIHEVLGTVELEERDVVEGSLEVSAEADGLMETKSSPVYICSDEGSARSTSFGMVVESGTTGNLLFIHSIESVSPESIADQIGLNPGDSLVKLNGMNVTGWTHNALLDQLAIIPTEEIDMTIKRSTSSGSVYKDMKLQIQQADDANLNLEDKSLSEGAARVKFSCQYAGSVNELNLDDVSAVYPYLTVCHGISKACTAIEESGAAPVAPDGKVGGNAAAVFKSGENSYLVVTKSGKLAGQKLNASSDICVVTNFDKDKWEATYNGASADILPTSDTPLHYAALNAHKELNWSESPGASLHGHALADGVKAAELGYPVSPEETLFSTPEDTEALMNLLKTHPYPDNKIFIRKGHGFVILGQDMAEVIDTFVHGVKPYL